MLRVGAGDASSAWRVMQRLYREGLVAVIGICDHLGEFGVENLAKIAQGVRLGPRFIRRLRASICGILLRAASLPIMACGYSYDMNRAKS